MSGIAGLGLYDDEEANGLTSGGALPPHLLDQSAARANQRVRAIMGQMASPSTPSKSLVDRASIKASESDAPVSAEPTPSPKDQLMAMDPEILRAMDKALENPPTEEAEVNYLIRVQSVIGKILAQFIRIAEKERVQKDDQKVKYNKATTEWGKYQKEVGDRGFNFTWIALGVMVSQFAFPQADREIISFLGKEGCNNLSNMFNTETQSKQKMVDAIGQLAYAEIQAMMNKGASDSNKQEFIQLLDKILNSLKEAARNG